MNNELWVARDRDGDLRLYNEKPIRYSEVFDYEDYWKGEYRDSLHIDPNLFSDLKWEDEPRQVKLVYLERWI